MKWRVTAHRAIFDNNMLLWCARKGVISFTVVSLESAMTFIERHERGIWAP